MRHRRTTIEYRRDILPRLSMEQVYGSHPWTERKDRRWGWRSRTCPFCGEGRSKPGRLSGCPQQLAFKCHHCDAHGGALEWIASMPSAAQVKG